MAILSGGKGIAVHFKKLSTLLILLLSTSIYAIEKPEVIAFVSFSMPEHAIRAWMKEAVEHDASINIRGLIGDNMPHTLEILQKFIQDNNNRGGINIDPVLFDVYGIDKVPAVVVRKYGSPDSPFDIVYGTSTIKEALRIIQETA